MLEQVQGEYHSLPHVPGTAPQLRFSHLVGYGARYYSYLLARAVASAIWQKNFQKNPYSEEAGKRYSELYRRSGDEARYYPTVIYFKRTVIKDFWKILAPLSSNTFFTGCNCFLDNSAKIVLSVFVEAVC